MLGRYFREVGIFLVYGWIFFAVFIFDWKPSTVFISFLLELVIILLFYVVFKFIDNVKVLPKRADEMVTLLNVILGTTILISFQAFLILTIIDELDDEMNRTTIKEMLFTKDVLILAISIIVVYLVGLLSVKGFKPKLSVLQDNFIYQVLSFSLVNIVGILAISIFEEITFKPVLVLLILSRLYLEIKFTHKIKLL